MLGYRRCGGRPEHWEARDVLAGRSEHLEEGLHWERPISTVRVRFTATQAVPRCWCGAPRSSAVPKADLVSFLGHECFTLGMGQTSIPKSVLPAAPSLPLGWTDVWHGSCGQSPGRARGAALKPSPALGLPGHAERHIWSSDPAGSGIPPVSALIPLLGHPGRRNTTLVGLESRRADLSLRGRGGTGRKSGSVG